MALDAAHFGAWEAAAFAPEKTITEQLAAVKGVTHVETQTYTIMVRARDLQLQALGIAHSADLVAQPSLLDAARLSARLRSVRVDGCARQERGFVAAPRKSGATYPAARLAPPALPRLAQCRLTTFASPDGKRISFVPAAASCSSSCPLGNSKTSKPRPPAPPAWYVVCSVPGPA